MEQNNNNQKTEALIESLRGLPRAKPQRDIFPVIMDGIKRPVGSIIPMPRLQWSAAAAVALLIINVMAIRTYTQIENLPWGQTTVESQAAAPLIDDFNLY